MPDNEISDLIIIINLEKAFVYRRKCYIFEFTI